MRRTRKIERCGDDAKTDVTVEFVYRGAAYRLELDPDRARTFVHAAAGFANGAIVTNRPLASA